MSKIERFEDGSVMFSGKEAVSVYHIITLKTALKMYAKTGMKINRAYSPKNMLACAQSFTGKKYKRGQYMEAFEDLDLVVQELKTKIA
jgi:hypothetical protein